MILPPELELQEHPLLPAPAPEQLREMILQHGAEGFLDFKSKRDRLIELAEKEPLDYGFELPAWELPDEFLALPEVDTVAAFGMNRGSKSWWAGKRFCEAARAYPDGLLIALSETEESSVNTAQKIIWTFFKSWLGKYNEQHKRHPVIKVNYTVANGFSDGKLVLPNHTVIVFATYKQDAGQYEGWEFGARVKALKKRPDGRPIENIGFWADESMSLRWLEVLTRRVRFRQAKGAWTFTPVRGITPAMKEFVGQTPTILRDQEAPLLPQARVPGCRPGCMPRAAIPRFSRARCVWFHLGDNPFGNYNQSVKAACAGKSTDYVERIAYGWARDTIARAFPHFGNVHIVKRNELPAVGTNYRVADPADVRPFFVIWVRVPPGEPRSLYIYRDWPDEQTYGEWAKPTERETTEETRRGWDGDRGPAQANLGFGIADYKAEWVKLEKIFPEGTEGDPYRNRLQAKLLPGQDGAEEIWGNKIDPRAGPNPKVTESGGTCLLWEFAKVHTHPAKKDTELEPLIFNPAPGLEVDKGVTQINEMLQWDDERPFDPLMNTPRLFVSEDCRQVIWALSNWTGRAGEEGACKDPVDTVRMAVTSADLVYINPQEARFLPGRGWK